MNASRHARSAHRGRLVALALLLPLALLRLPAHAQGTPDTPPENVFSFAVAADAEIDNDLMSATLVVQAEAKEPAALADEINATMRWALEALQPYAAIERETRDYRTWPRHDSSQARRLIGWRGSQTLVLESDDFEAMTRAVQTLQERLQVQAMTMSAKPETRREATDALIERALRAFGERALLIRTSMGAAGYRILEADVQTDESFGAPPVMRGRMMAMESADGAISEPAVAAGTSRVTVRVSGRIRLDPDPAGDSR